MSGNVICGDIRSCVVMIPIIRVTGSFIPGHPGGSEMIRIGMITVGVPGTTTMIRVVADAGTIRIVPIIVLQILQVHQGLLRAGIKPVHHRERFRDQDPVV